MNANIHRLLVTIGAIFAGFAPILTADDALSLGIDPAVGRACGLIAALVVVVATAIRASFPDKGEA